MSPATATPSTSTSTPPAPQSSAIPPSTAETSSTPHRPVEAHPDTSKSVKPRRKPLLRLELRDLSSSGSRAFLRLLHASSTLEDAVDTVLRQLYSGLETHCIPSTRSVTLILRAMPGVAYTTSLDIDDDHKEIHFNTDYINHVPETRQKEEMQGVIVHEMVHCWQHNALGTAPGGLIEGIADWVRLKAGFAPPHWKRQVSEDQKWDAGYERTGFFLEWLEEEHGADIVRKINDGLRGCKYDADTFWHDCCGKNVEKLWKEYKASLDGDDDSSKPAKGKEQEAEHDTAGSTSKTTEDSSSQDTTNEDHRSARQKARRGGNMHIPIRPGTGT